MLMLRGEEGFNRELALTLKAHRHYYNRGPSVYNPQGNERNDARAWNCLAGLGFQAWARMLGMRVNASSEYLPAHLERRRATEAEKRGE